MQITKIEIQKKRKDRYNIYIDDEFRFGLDEGVLLKFGLRQGDVIDQELIDKIEKEEIFAKAFSSAISFLKSRERSEKEIRDKLKQKDYNENAIKYTIDKLKEIDYINDKRFCEMFVRDRIKLKPKGKRALSIELRQKGVSSDIIEEVLDEMIDVELEGDMIKRVYDKNIRKYSHLSENEKKQKIIKYLMSKGFDYSKIEKFLNKNK